MKEGVGNEGRSERVREMRSKKRKLKERQEWQTTKSR